MDTRELNALVNLLDDQDQEIYDHVHKKIISYGREAIPTLEEAWSISMNPLLQNRIEHVIHIIQFDALYLTLKSWYYQSVIDYNHPQNHIDLLNGSLLIAKYQYPDLDEQRLRNELEQIKRDIWLEINESQTALEKVKILNQVLFGIHGFAGNTSNYHAPQNSFINIVLESKKGNPLLLSVIYSYLAQSLDIPIYGVNLPEHFVLAYEDNELSLTSANFSNKILFYINAFSKGSLFDRNELDAFLRQLGLPPHKMYYEPCNNRAIIQRMLHNLVNAYNRLHEEEKVEEIKQLLAIFE